MKTIIIAIAALIIGFALAYAFLPAGEQPVTATAASAPAKAKQLYTCGMHPEIISDEPGFCPICGMKLTPKKDGATAGSVVIDASTRQNMGLVTTPARMMNLTRTVHAFGKIAYAEPNIYSVNLKFSGWAEKLYVDYEGQTVHKGDPLVDIYSPDLVAAQKEFLIAHDALAGASGEKAKKTFSAMLASAKDRLRNWDITEAQIDALADKGTITRTMTLYSPADGVVTAKHVAEGDKKMPGAELYRIADISRVWAVASVYEQDVPFVEMGQKAIITTDNIPGKSYEATVSYIAPFLDNQRQVDVRLDIDNHDLKLKPDMYASVALQSDDYGQVVAVPRSAVINSGVRQVVYLASMDGSFLPRVVTTGAVGENDMIEIKSGLAPKEEVVTSGQFLLDSESRLGEALSADDAMEHNQSDEAKMDSHTASDGDSTAKVSPDDVVYTCPMPAHYHVLQYGPGECPECGMKLVPVSETKNENVYVCPMTEDHVVSSEPGTCPKCGMKLVKYRADAQGKKAAAHDVTGQDNHSEALHQNSGGKYICSAESCGIVRSEPGNCPKCGAALVPLETALSEETAPQDTVVYTCPMPADYHVLRYGPGECPECGMALVPVTETENENVYACPMTECGVVQRGPGDCPKCGMHLKPYRGEADSDG